MARIPLKNPLIPTILEGYILIYSYFLLLSSIRIISLSLKEFFYISLSTSVYFLNSLKFSNNVVRMTIFEVFSVMSLMVS